MTTLAADAKIAFATQPGRTAYFRFQNVYDHQGGWNPIHPTHGGAAIELADIGEYSPLGIAEVDISDKAGNQSSGDVIVEPTQAAPLQPSTTTDR